MQTGNGQVSFCYPAAVATAPIPTLSAWGLAVFVLILLVLGVLRLSAARRPS
jgi:hypothetical protein